MTALRQFSRAVLAAVVATALTAAMVAPVPAAAADPPGFDWAALVPTAQSFADIQSTLPEDETAAIERLVDIVWGAASLAAVAATGEILRRAGLPLVSADGPVVALPDGNVIINAPIMVEFLPTLTDTARNGTFYRPGQLGELLQEFGFARELPTDREVVGLLADWGKGKTTFPRCAPPERPRGPWPVSAASC